MTIPAMNDSELREIQFASELFGEICKRRMTLDELAVALPARGSRMVADDVEIASKFLEAHLLARPDGACFAPTIAAETAYLLWSAATSKPSPIQFAYELFREICEYRMTLDELAVALPARGVRMVADDVEIASKFLEAHFLARPDGACFAPTLAGETAYLLWSVAPLKPSLD